MGHHDEFRAHHERRGVPWVLRIIGMVIGGLALAVLLGFLFGWLVMALWNWLMPMLFGLKAITYWQAFGIVLLAKILFGGGHGCHGHHGKHHHKHWKHHGWKGHGEDWAPSGDYGNWRYYEDYWKQEGKAAFEAYIDKKKQEKE